MRPVVLVNFVSLVIYSFQFCKSSNASSDVHSIEYDLHKSLLNGYDKTILPIANYGDKVTVQIQPILYSLIQVDEKIGSMEFLQWLELRWRDAYLRWDPVKYQNVLRTTFLIGDIWIPDIVILNQMDDIKYPLQKDNVLAEIFFDGTVTVAYNMLVNLRCHNYNLAEFPFDEQACSTRYGSWSHSSDQIVITMGNVIDNANQFREHAEWTIVAFGPLFSTTKKIVRTSLLRLQYDNGTDFLLNDTRIFEEAHYELRIRRKPGYYIYTLVAPTLITTTLCLMGLFSPFDVSGNREEKVSLGLTAMLSMTVILMLVAGEMPRSSGTQPLLGQFVMFQIVLCSVATIATAIIMMIHQRMELSATIPPQWLVKVTYTLLCIKESINWKNKVADITSADDNGKTDKQRNNSGEQSSDIYKVGNAKYANASSNSATLAELQKLTTNIKLKSLFASVKHHWINIFRLVDFILLIIFNLANVIGTVIMFS